ncbi:TauD/TfdA family dioxygenase [Nisaea sp.]|uniref:TauD/TfdA family dioxygenase n=1 Tax=Nisaea sp. TaxID=2024842 RepID=UPI003B5189AA
MATLDGTVRQLFEGDDFAVIVEADGSSDNAASWVSANLAGVEELAKTHPVVVLRGIGLSEEQGFPPVRDLLVGRPANYVYRSTPRTEVLEGVLTATEYPAGEEILMHCENAYQRDWPLRLVFCCITPAETGGQTPVADVRKVTRALGDDLLDEVERRGIRYIRNYHEGFDLDWKIVFQTEDRGAVERFCKANDIEFEWTADGHLKTAQTCQGTARHPVTGERLWFNQAHLFHASALGEDVLEDLVDIFGEDGLPRDACYGDGAPIPGAVLEKVRTAFQAAARQFDWQAGDVMLVDNMLASHARRPFTGSRRVLVSMGRMHSELEKVAGAAE